MITWTNWTGAGLWVTNVGQVSGNVVQIGNLMNDALFTHPTNDWRLPDLFTTAFNDNATRGQMSINQTNVAAWSALFSGVNVLTNTDNSTYSSLFIQPVGGYDPSNFSTWPPLLRIINGINAKRASFPGGVFHQLGDILSVPELTVTSPYLNTNALSANNYALNDEVYERIPQQILGLIKSDHTPRFVIYAYGQALKPAEHSLVTSGPFFGLCTNYQVTAEAATRAVVRIDGAPSKPRVIIENYNALPPD
jgi:hypothetical protein